MSETVTPLLFPGKYHFKDPEISGRKISEYRYTCPNCSNVTKQSKIQEYIKCNTCGICRNSLEVREYIAVLLDNEETKIDLFAKTLEKLDIQSQQLAALLDKFEDSPVNGYFPQNNTTFTNHQVAPFDVEHIIISKNSACTEREAFVLDILQYILDNIQIVDPVLLS